MYKFHSRLPLLALTVKLGKYVKLLTTTTNVQLGLMCERASETNVQSGLMCKRASKTWLHSSRCHYSLPIVMKIVIHFPYTHLFFMQPSSLSSAPPPRLVAKGEHDLCHSKRAWVHHREKARPWSRIHPEEEDKTDRVHLSLSEANGSFLEATTIEPNDS